MCVCTDFEQYFVVVSWSEFKSWLSEKKQKPESVLSLVQHQKSHRMQQVNSGTSHLWSKVSHWSEAGTKLREQAVCVFQLQVSFGTRFRCLGSLAC